MSNTAYEDCMVCGGKVPIGMPHGEHCTPQGFRGEIGDYVPLTPVNVRVQQLEDEIKTLTEIVGKNLAHIEHQHKAYKNLSETITRLKVIAIEEMIKAIGYGSGTPDIWKCEGVYIEDINEYISKLREGDDE